ncbi:uncharacterized protein BXZ73DRAFT_72990 [Epithele typhae]|uniref:uncharacterized protein n=1 Tax=Epithele typhae TaxID=378194 RepID=UPI002008591E|nr:uncharacterized protein BXZ73DRAFT_72990 [Epithele typhae]KAH9946161.1 hypothetical protein BXZ73DRAFT_72990 [Epithele typhae]
MPRARPLPTPIPRPAGRVTSFIPNDTKGLAYHMELSSTPEQTQVYCALVEDIARLYDDYIISRGNSAFSGPEREEFKKLAVDRIPMMRNFEGAWPVMLIASEHRYKVSRPDGKRSGFRGFFTRHAPHLDTQPAHVVRTARQHGIQQRGTSDSSVASRRGAGKRTRGPNCRTLARSILQELGPSLSPPTPAHDPSCESEPPPSAELPRVAMSTAVPAPRTVAASPKGARLPAVATFLMSLTPEQTGLGPLFHQLGIDDLGELLQMKERYVWLYSLVKEDRLTEFQFALIKNGLKKLETAPWLRPSSNSTGAADSSCA